MKIYIIQSCPIIDIALPDSPITDIQSISPCRINYAKIEWVMPESIL